MVEASGGSISFSAEEAAALFAALKRREEVLDRLGASVLRRLERFLYDALSIEDMERLLREAAR